MTEYRISEGGYLWKSLSFYPGRDWVSAQNMNQPGYKTSFTGETWRKMKLLSGKKPNGVDNAFSQDELQLLSHAVLERADVLFDAAKTMPEVEQQIFSARNKYLDLVSKIEIMIREEKNVQAESL